MPALVYLDTARLGAMSPAAQEAQLDFVRLAAEEPSCLYWERFLREGFTWPPAYQQRFPGLRTWTGVAGLKQSIRRIVGTPDDRPVLLASRSLSLVRLAVACQFRVCSHVLATDLSWLSYQQALEQRAWRTGNRVTTVPLREQILYGGWTVDDVAQYLADTFAEGHCDGLFLPAVDHLGVRLPIGRIVEQIRQRGKLRFCLIDAAQAFCQVALDECLSCADFLVAGSHKWMGAYVPMGIGLFGHGRTGAMIERRLSQLCQTGRVHDPLLHFTEQLDGGELDAYSETANLTSLFACAGAAADRLAASDKTPPPDTSAIDDTLAVMPRPSGDWRLLRTDAPMRSCIALLESSHEAVRDLSPARLRQLWLEAGCVVSAYEGGRVRVSVRGQNQVAPLAHPHECRKGALPSPSSAVSGNNVPMSREQLESSSSASAQRPTCRSD